MTATLRERTVLPPADRQRLASALAALTPAGTGRAALVGPDGSRVELPPDVYDLLGDVLTALSQGLAITVAPTRTVLSTGEAAHLLGISRPTLVRLLESGEIPFEQPARHRRVRLADVLAYQERARRARAFGLDEMVRVSEEAGLYDLSEDMVTFVDHVTARGRTVSVPTSLPRLPVERALATVVLPIHLNWSAPGRRFSLADRSQRARVYEIVLREGGPDDILTYVDGALLIDVWDELVLPRDVRAAWSPVIRSAIPVAA